MNFRGLDSLSTETSYAYILGTSSDVNNTNESGRIVHYVTLDGTARNFLDLKGYNGVVGQGEIIINEDGHDIDVRVESDTSTSALVVEGSSGNIGIGTTNPTAVLHVNSSAPILTAQDSDATTTASYGGYMSLRNSTGNELAWIGDGSATTSEISLYGGSNHNISLYAGGTKHVLLTTAGRVGIGATAPDATLLVNATGGTTALVAQQGSGTSEVLAVRNSTGNDVWLLTLQGAQNNRPTVYDGGTGTLQVSGTFYSGRLGIGTTDPTAKLHVSSSESDLVRIENTTAAHMLINGSTGHTGIGTTSPARKLHINDTMRLQPRSSAPTNASLGDLYVDSDTSTLCFYNSTSWMRRGRRSVYVKRGHGTELLPCFAASKRSTMNVSAAACPTPGPSWKESD